MRRDDGTAVRLRLQIFEMRDYILDFRIQLWSAGTPSVGMVEFMLNLQISS